MKTSRFYRIFIMAVDTVVLFILRLFMKFTKVKQYEPTEEASLGDTPHAVESTRPEKLGIRPELEVDGQPAESYRRSADIYFAEDRRYSDLEGIVTFRGDHHRSGGAYGKAELKEKKLSIAWSVDTGRLQKGYGHGFWSGSGWTGQPLIVRWTPEQKANMDLLPEKKEKTSLAEVIYSTMDGKVYFLDLEDGSRTREGELEVGLPFKGAGALDPRGYAVYLGPGDSGPTEDKYARSFVYSLTDREKLFEFGGKDPFSLRKFHGYDSSHLVDTETDTLIEPGENGILYTFKLNTHFDANTGKVTMDPTERVKLRYRTSRSSEKEYWLGMEDSSVLWKNFIYIADNGGNLLCIDLNTMELVWAQDVADDTNGSPVFSVEDGVPYLYIATSLHWKACRFFKLGNVPIFKINAVTGEYVWVRSYFCNTIAGVSGGVQATCALGRGNSEELVFFPVARTPQVRSGLLVALNKKTGAEAWRMNMERYAWSSPVLVENSAGETFLLQGDSKGTLFLIDAPTGKVLHSIELGANIEATPAVFEDMLVVGTRGQKIFGVKLS